MRKPNKDFSCAPTATCNHALLASNGAKHIYTLESNCFRAITSMNGPMETSSSTCYLLSGRHLGTTAN